MLTFTHICMPASAPPDSKANRITLCSSAETLSSPLRLPRIKGAGPKMLWSGSPKRNLVRTLPVLPPQARGALVSLGEGDDNR